MNSNKLASSLSLRKLFLSALVAAPLVTLPVPLWAIPDVTSTNLTSNVGSATVITQVSGGGSSNTSITTPDRTVLTWNALGSAGSTIGTTDVLIFNLPTTSSAVLNNVTGGAATTIDGTISSNGRVYVLNPNGVTLSSTGTITAAGVALSTINDADYTFLTTGNLSFSSPATTPVSTAGTITVGQSGTVALAGNTATVGGAINAGTLTVTTLGATPAVTLTTGLAVGNAGNATVAGYGNLTITSGGGDVNLNSGASAVTISGGNLTVNTVGTTGGGAVTQGAGVIDIGGTSAPAGSLSITTKGSSTAGSVTLGNVEATGGKLLTASLNTGTTSLTVATGDVQLNTSTITSSAATALSVTATAGNITSGGSVSAAKVNLITSAAGKNITYAANGNVTFGTITNSGTGNVSLTGTGAVFSVPAITTGALVLGGGTLTQTGALTATTATIQASGNATLNSANDFTTLIVKNVSGNASITDLNGVILGNGTNVTGNLTLTATAGAIALGAAPADTVSIGGNLSLAATGLGGGITDATDKASVLGTLTLNAGAGNDVTLDGSTGNGVGLNSQYGKISLTNANTAKIFEATTMNIAAATAANFTAYSASNIINSGKIAVTGTLTIGAGTAAAPGSVALTYHNATVGSGNSIANLRVLTDTQLAGSATIGNYLASSLSWENEGGFSGLQIPLNIYSAGLPGNVTLTDANNTGISTAGVLALTGTLTLNQPTTTAAAGISLINVANQWGALTVTAAGDVAATASTPYTVNATLTEGTVAGKVASFTSGDALTIGSFTSGYTGAGGVTFTSAATKSISDSVGGIGIFGAVSFTGGSVSVTKAGHSFGGVTITTSGNGNATLVEGSTLKLATVNVGTGTLTATSSGGAVLQTAGITASSATVTAGSGNVTLDQTGNAITGAINATASGSFTYKSNSTGAVLGNITAGGNSTVDLSGGAALTITQGTGGVLNVFGNTSFVTNGAAVITLGNTGNRFGGLTLTTGTGAITLKENTTINLKSVTTSGAFTVTSETGNIIDSGSGTVTATGTTSLNAPNGSITLGLAGSDYVNVSLNTGGTASIVDGVSNIILGASNVAGALSVTNTAGNINQSGAIIVNGNATFIASAGTSSITLGNSFNQFGPIQFVAGTGSVLIDELTTMNLRAGSVASGQVTLNTGGNFITSGSGSSTFLGLTAPSLTINATGTITPGAGSLIVRNGLVVNSTAAKDLSALSLSGNLFSVAPTNQGTGTYTAPSP